MRILLFEDAWVERLAPITHSRPPFAISCGGYRLLDLVRDLELPVAWNVRLHLRAVLDHETRRDGVPTNGSADRGTLLVNSAIVPAAAVRKTLADVIRAGRPGQLRMGARLALAWLPGGTSPPSTAADPAQFDAFVDGLDLPPIEAAVKLFDWPHDVVREHQALCGGNLEDRLARGDYAQLEDGVFVGPGAKVGPYVVTDSSRGPIVVDAEASIGPYCYLSGPVYVGPKSRVIEHSALKDGVTLGHTTKVGGEVEASVIEPYTNKQHHGFLGHSYLGSWINLGAGTCNSDLKNTYGPVNMKYGNQKVSSGMQFLGCIVGDYSKTAINTSVFTGKTVGVCSMLYGFVTTNVPSFVNYARSFGQVTESPVEVMIAMQGRMFARRNVAQLPADVMLLRDMYELTRHERQMTGGPLSF